MLLFPWVVSLALAEEPTRCVATVNTPLPTCSLHGTFTVTAGGKTEAAATKSVRAALDIALEKSADASRVAQPTTDRAAHEGCYAVADTAHVDCFADASLKEAKFCFITFADADCWNGDVLELEDIGWKVFVAGTAKMCSAVSERLSLQNYTDAEVRRAKCAASCLSQTVVRCP